MVHDLWVRHAVPVGAFVGAVPFAMLNVFGSRDNGHLLSKYAIDPRNPPILENTHYFSIKPLSQTEGDQI